MWDVAKSLSYNSTADNNSRSPHHYATRAVNCGLNEYVVLMLCYIH